MKIIQVGLGTSGRQWLKVLERAKSVELVACVDPEPADHDWFKKAHSGVPVYVSLEQALTNHAAESAVVVSPLPCRATDIRDALCAGLAVLAEAPVAGTISEVRSIHEAARKAGRALLVRNREVGFPAEKQLKRLVGGGKIGRVNHVSVLDRRPGAGSDPVGSSQLADVAVGNFDSLGRVLGVRPVSVMCCDASPGSRAGSVTEAFLEMQEGVHVHYFGALGAMSSEHETWIQGEKGVLWTDQRLIWWRKKGWPRFIPIGLAGRRAEGSGSQADGIVLADFLQQARNKTAEPAGFEGHLSRVAMLQAAVESDRTKSVVGVEPVSRVKLTTED